MVSDIELLANQDTYITKGEDLPLIDGYGNAQQSVALSTLDITELFIGNRVTHELLNKLKGDVRSALQRNPNVDQVESVNVLSIDEDTDTVTVSVTIDGGNTFNINLSSSFS